MSSRALRKLKGENDILVPELAEKLEQDEESSANDEDADPVEVPQPKKAGKKKKKKAAAVVNPFDLVWL